MAKRLYGSLNNRFDEGKNFTKRDIREGDDITMYYWSDRHCYYITKVIDQKHIFVKEYQVCANHDKPNGMGHQDWMYFKTRKEEAEYLKKFFPDTEMNVTEQREQEWVFRNNKWKECIRYTKDVINKIIERDGWCRASFTENEQRKLDEGKEVCKYYSIQPISFGVRDYHYDWEF